MSASDASPSPGGSAPAFVCLLCGGERGRRRLAKGELELFACEDCGFVQIQPLPTAQQLETMYAEDPHYGVELLRDAGAFLERERALFARLAAEGVAGPLLDVGAAAGLALQAAREVGWEVVGLEPSRPNAERIRRELGATVHSEGIDTAPLEPASFGLVLFSHSLEHLTDPVGALAKARECLRPGGRVHVRVPHWNAAKRRAVGPAVAWIYPHHLGYFTRRTLQEACRRAGLRPLAAATGPMLGRDYPFALALARRLGLEGPGRRFLRLGERPLESLIGDDLRLDCPPWRFRAALALTHGLLGVWPERLFGRLGWGEELSLDAVRD